MRVAIVNDVPLVAEGLRRILIRQDDIDIIWIASDGQEAVDKAAQDLPDVLLMDLVMPVMDGVEATRLIMERNPCPILVVTASVDEHISQVFQAMSYGALDAVTTPVVNTGDPDAGADDLILKIKLVQAAAEATTLQLAAKRSQNTTLDSCVEAMGLVAIGASSGGPQAITRVLSQMSADLPVAVVVIQHVDEKFAPRFVDWLKGHLGRPVMRAIEGGKLCQGCIYVAVTSDHLILNADRRLVYTTIPEDYPYRPSVDVFFNSVVENWHLPASGVLLTGMGADGAMGLRRMRENGFYTVSQDCESSAVYGMPKAAHDLRAAMDELPLDKIGAAIERYMLTRVR